MSHRQILFDQQREDDVVANSIKWRDLREGLNQVLEGKAKSVSMILDDKGEAQLAQAAVYAWAIAKKLKDAHGKSVHSYIENYDDQGNLLPRGAPEDQIAESWIHAALRPIKVNHDVLEIDGDVEHTGVSEIEEPRFEITPD